MCGGAGTRFWPFSRSNMPKQFLDFFGSGRTLLQLTVERIADIVDKDNIILVTNSDYAPLVREQLPDIKPENVLCEPARRNTAPCILWAARHIYARCPEASIVTLPSDHLILREKVFLEAIRRGFDFVEQGDRLLTIGINPTSPNTGYGYIQRGEDVKDWQDFMKVKTFTEKPNLEMARIFVDSGEFFWNAGIFLWTADAIIKAFDKYAPDIASLFNTDPDAFADPAKETAFIADVFPRSSSISVDYAIMEKADNVYVETSDPGWSDLGTWQSLYSVSPKNSDGNVTQNCRVMAENCSGTVFAIAGDKIVVADGLKDYIVAENGNALLIYPLSKEQEIRRITGDVKALFGEEYV